VREAERRDLSLYPERSGERDRWVLERRPERNRLDPWRPSAFLMETEVGPEGQAVEVATIFLTNRECPYRCLMCDLWRNTLEETVPEGAITAQVQYALERLSPARHVKLYNAGSFFDPRAIPPAEHAGIARLVSRFERVIVECHPALVGARCLEFRDLLPGRLEVAMGLETAHPQVLERLNKRMTLAQFQAAAAFLAREGIDLRVFILVRPPWLSEAEGVEWARRSLDFAFACGAAVCSLIPTRAGNGAMEALAAAGQFFPPSLASLEAALEYGLDRRAGQEGSPRRSRRCSEEGVRPGRVFADLWDIEKFAGCPVCSGARINRLRAMNRSQQIAPPVPCDRCGGSSR
jgi:radical SAM enzyme (TIGR01210 family)